AEPNTPVLLVSPVWIDTTDGWALRSRAWMSSPPPPRWDVAESDEVVVWRSMATTTDALTTAASRAAATATATSMRRVTGPDDRPLRSAMGRVGSGGSPANVGA